MKTRLRQFLFFVLYGSGVLWLWRFYHRNEIRIFMLHGVMDAEESTGWLPLRPQLSRKRLETSICILRRYYRFISLPAAIDMIAGRIPVKPYSLVLTFDEGYRNNITHALPILRRYGIPATVFLTTGPIDRREPLWFDRLDYALQQVNVDGHEVQIGQETIRLNASDRTALRHSYKQLRDSAKALPRSDKEMLDELEGIAARLEAESGRSLSDIFEDDDWSALLTWEEIKKAAAEGVCVGSHTVDHLRLGLVDDETARDQLKSSKEAIAAHTGQPCDHFCYPDGSFNQRVVEIVRECGYKSAVTVMEGTNRIGDDPMTLCRIPMPLTGGTTEMLAIVSGLSIAMAKWKAAVNSALSGLSVLLRENTRRQHNTGV